MSKSSVNVAILHFAAPPVIGGVESVIGHHARLMNEHGHNVRIIAGRGETITSDIPTHTVPLFDSQHPELLAAKQVLDQGLVPENFDLLVSELVSEIDRVCDGTDVLVAHNVCVMAKNLFLTAALRKFSASAAAPLLIGWHHDLAATAERYASELHSGYPWQHLREDWPETNMRHVVVSQARQTELCDLLGLSRAKVTVVPSGIDSDRFCKLEDETKNLLDRYELRSASPILLLPVRITRRKNIELALRITAEVGRHFPNIALVVTGPPGAHNAENSSYLAELQELRDQLSLKSIGGDQAAAIFLSESSPSFLSDEAIGDFYRLADALLLTSNDEGFGIPIIESGFSGLPIFCSDLPPLKEIAGDYAHYFSLDASAGVISDAIVSLLKQDPRFLLKQHVRSTYDWHSLYQQRIAPLLEDYR